MVSIISFVNFHSIEHFKTFFWNKIEIQKEKFWHNSCKLDFNLVLDFTKFQNFNFLKEILLAAADWKLQEYFAFERKYSRCVLALISIIWQTLDLQILVWKSWQREYLLQAGQMNNNLTNLV